MLGKDSTVLRRGDFQRQVELLRLSGQWERLLAVEPSDEQAHRELMRAALVSGNRPAAIRWYGRLRAALERELGLPPSLESRSLYEECVAGLPPTPRRCSQALFLTTPRCGTRRLPRVSQAMERSSMGRCRR